MNQQSKRAIKALVLDLRHTLEDDIAIQLKRYGFAGGRWIEPDKLPHIWNDSAAMADRLRMDAALAQELRRMGLAGPAEATPAQREEAVGWFVREIAYTHLNRLAALKALEVRGLIPKVITTQADYGWRSRMHYDLLHAHPDLAASPDEGLAEAIRAACRLVYREFRLLFDVGDTAEGRPTPINSLVWPSHTALKACVAAINGLDERADNSDPSLWLEDEIIGWLYQFYNAEQKEAIRKQGKPRRPAEVAIINQFFTPRWIVKFLVDNTLGRLWLEMHPDSERVRAKCDYLVPEPLPSPSEGEGSGVRAGFPLDPDSPINNPKARPRRAAKRPQDLRLIDIACGTMHFGHYAFEVFQEIYRDAREQGWVAGPDALPDADVPAAILRHNLYGVDIDLRAVQLAGLALYIKARTAEAALGAEETGINQVNLVVADAVLPDDGPRAAFLAQYAANKKVQQAVAQVLDEMANVAEVGSLLRVEERLRQALDEAGYPAAGAPGAAAAWRTNRQAALPSLEPPARQLSLADLPGAAPEQWGAHYTVAHLLDDLRAFAAQALREHDLNAQLFAEEASKSVRLLDVFLNDYDVVVMNPPYNKPKEMLPRAQRYLQKAFKYGANDLYAAFFERAHDLLVPGGYCGALTSRTYFFLAAFERFRRYFLLPHTQIRTVADLGFGMLDDAAVETCASVIERRPTQPSQRSMSVFLRLLDAEDKPQVVHNICAKLDVPDQKARLFAVIQDDFSLTPRCSFAYWVPRRLLELFTIHRLFSDIGDVCMGLSTADDERFLRHAWEVNWRALAPVERWVPHAKGGEFSRYYQDIYLVVDWLNDGKALSAYSESVIRNATYYFREGLTYPHDTVKGLNVRYLPPNATFGAKGPGIFLHDPSHLWSALGYFNSALAQQLMLLMTPSRSWEVGLMQQMPFKMPSEPQRGTVPVNAQRIYGLKANWDTGNELCTRFDAPWPVQAHRGRLLADAQGPMLAVQAPIPQSSTLPALLDYVCAVESAADAYLQQLQAEIDEAVYGLYEIDPADRALIERELGGRPPELVWPQMERKSDEEKRKEHARRLASWCLLEALKADPDGILTLDEALAGVRRGLEVEFGEDAAFRLEADWKAVIGQDIAGWLDGSFGKWHTALYKSTPIIWHLASADARRSLNLFVYYHKLSADTLRKVQTLYLWPARRRQESLRATAQAGSDPAGVQAAELALEALAEFERRLLAVIEARVAYTPPEWAEGPFRGGRYDPVLDDGVRVNLMPLQEAGVLRHRKLV